MTTNTLQTLPTEWQNWVRENITRGCDPAGLAQEISSKLGYDILRAEYSVADAYLENHPERVTTKALPVIVTTTGRISAAGRNINVLFSLGLPRMALLGNVLSEKECDALIASGQKRFRRSAVLGDSSTDNRITHERTSETAELQHAENALIATIDARLAALTNWPIENGEPLQLQKYGIGNEYRAHHDWLDPNHPSGVKHMQSGGQRLATIILYLTDVEAGGGTAFPTIDVQVQPKRGNALFFLNTNPYGVPNHKTLHAGLPVQKGCKIIASKWLREHPVK